MTRARSIAKAADRRLWLAALVRAAGRCATIAAIGGLALVGADRVFAFDLPVWALIASPLAIGAAAATLLAVRARRRAGDASIVLDHALGFRDRVSSALALERVAHNGEANDPFLTLAQRDADRVASDARVRSAIPLRFDNWWIAAPFAAAALVTAAMFTPVFDVLGRAERRMTEVALEEQREEAAVALEEVREELRKATANESAEGATPDELRALEELERELAEGAIDADDARSEAASRLEDLAQSFEDSAEREDRSLDALAERLGRRDEASASSSASALDDALKRNDFDSAAQALEDLRRNIARDSSSTPAEREQLARDLDSLARSLEQASGPRESGEQPAENETPSDNDAAPQNQSAADALREHGVPSDAANELADSQSANEIREALQDRGLAPEQADRLAERIAEENRNAAAEEQAQRDLRDLSEAIEKAAENARDPETIPPTPPPTPSPSKTPPEEPSRPDTGAERPEPGEPTEEQRTPAAGEDRPQNTSDPSKRESEKDPGAPERTPQQGPAQDVGSDQGDDNTAEKDKGRQVDDAQRPDGNPQPGSEDAPGSNADDAASPSNQKSPDGAQPANRDAQGKGAGQEGKEQRPGGNADRASERDAPGSSTDEGSPSGDQSGQGEANDGVGRALDKVREIAQRQRMAQQSREQAERLREQAERVMQDMTPQEREELRRLAEQIARERGSSIDDFADARTSDMDARRPSDPENDAGRVIAEWLTEGKPDADASRGAVDAKRRLAEAAQGAQRAIEEQQAPSRYSDIIRRYFQRLPAAVESAAPTPSAPDAADVRPAPAPAPGGGG
jgi:hypothetical protein